MIPLAIESMGAFTSVGGDVPTTMASILTGVQRFTELGVIGARGQPVVGAPSMIPRETTGLDRLTILGMLALDESVAAAPERCRRPLPMIVCCGEEDDLEGPPSELLARILVDSANDSDPKSSRVVARGRAGLAEALALVSNLISSGRWPGCHLLAVDSLTDGQALQRLIDEERVIQPGQPDALMPGEAAVALLLTRPQRARNKAASIRIASSYFAARAASAESPRVPKSNLAAALRRSLTEGGVASSELAALLHDGSGSRRHMEEIALSQTMVGIGGVQVFTPMMFTGETGAASGPLGLAAMAFYIEKGIVNGPGACVFTGEADSCGAALLTGQPATRHEPLGERDG